MKLASARVTNDKVRDVAEAIEAAIHQHKGQNVWEAAALAAIEAFKKRAPRVPASKKHTPEQAEAIRAMRASGMQRKVIAKRFGLSERTIGNICEGVTPAVEWRGAHFRKTA